MLVPFLGVTRILEVCRVQLSRSQAIQRFFRSLAKVLGMFPEVCATPACVEDFGISWRLLLPVAGEFLRQGRRGKPRAYM